MANKRELINNSFMHFVPAVIITYFFTEVKMSLAAKRIISEETNRVSFDSSLLQIYYAREMSI